MRWIGSKEDEKEGRWRWNRFVCLFVCLHLISQVVFIPKETVDLPRARLERYIIFRYD